MKPSSASQASCASGSGVGVTMMPPPRACRTWYTVVQCSDPCRGRTGVVAHSIRSQYQA